MSRDSPTSFNNDFALRRMRGLALRATLRCAPGSQTLERYEKCDSVPVDI